MEEKKKSKKYVLNYQISLDKQKRKQAWEDDFQSWLDKKMVIAKQAGQESPDISAISKKYTLEKVETVLLEDKTSDVHETKEGQERLVDGLLDKTKVDKAAPDEPVVQYEVLSYMVQNCDDYRKLVLDHYCDHVLPKELQKKHKNKEVKKPEKLSYVSPEELQRQLIEMQIAATMADNALHVCVDISSVPQEEAKIYRDQVIAGLNSENFAKENYTIICANKTQADALSTPLLKCNYL